MDKTKSSYFGQIVSAYDYDIHYTIINGWKILIIYIFIMV